jgi:hypothetical protein
MYSRQIRSLQRRLLVFQQQLVKQRQVLDYILGMLLDICLDIQLLFYIMF